MHLQHGVSHRELVAQRKRLVAILHNRGKDTLDALRVFFGEPFVLLHQLADKVRNHHRRMR